MEGIWLPQTRLLDKGGNPLTSSPSEQISCGRRIVVDRGGIICRSFFGRGIVRWGFVCNGRGVVLRAQRIAVLARFAGSVGIRLFVLRVAGVVRVGIFFSAGDQRTALLRLRNLIIFLSSSLGATPNRHTRP